MSMFSELTESQALCRSCERKLWQGDHDSHNCTIAKSCACPVCHTSAPEILEVLDAIDAVVAKLPDPPEVPSPRHPPAEPHATAA